ncbi:MAG: hypothetical protein Kow0090_15940 [Myxococcota bacterium]
MDDRGLCSLDNRKLSVVLVLFFGLFYASYARAELTPVVKFRNGFEFRYLLNTTKTAVFSDGSLPELKESLQSVGAAVESLETINGVKVITSKAALLPVLSKSLLGLSKNNLKSGSIKGVGPVYFEGANLAISTGRIWVYFPEGTKRVAVEKRLTDNGYIVADYIEAAHSIALVEPLPPFSISEKVSELRKMGYDAEEELMQRYFQRLVPDDQYFNLQWFLNNTGDNVTAAYYGGKVDALAMADIRAVWAWDVNIGDAESIVAVIDSGVDCTHPELEDKCLSPYNAITDEPNGQPPAPGEDPSGGHGTAVAGIVAAPIDGVGVAGVCPNCSIVPIRLVDSGYYLTDYMILQAFKHAVDSGAGVINNSWGPDATGEYVVPISKGEQEGIKYAEENGRGGLGTLVVYAAGNSSLDTKWYGQLQTGKPNVVVVAATNQFDLRAVYSNFGEHIDVAAPSNDIYLTPAIVTLGRVGVGDLASGYTRSFGGTSSAAPVVSGVLGLMLSVNKELTATEAAEILKATADKIDADGGFYDEKGHSPKYGYGRVNAYRAVKAAQLGVATFCEPTADVDDCEVHLDENCDGYLEEGCAKGTAVGVFCETTEVCGEGENYECPASGKVRGFCTYDCTQKLCPSGSVCADGLCARECTGGAECAEEFVCSNETLGICLLKCESDDHCGEDEKCDLESSICVLDTDGSIGSKCRADECKGFEAFCLDESMGFPGGYCTHTCERDKDCDGIGKCIETQYGGFCYRKCSFDGDCRPEYVCQQAGIRAGTCHRKCTSRRYCATDDPQWGSIECDTATGRCIDVSVEGEDSGEEDDGAVEEDGGDEPDVIEELDASEDDEGEEEGEETDDDDDDDDNDNDNNDSKSETIPPEKNPQEKDGTGCSCRIERVR